MNKNIKEINTSLDTDLEIWELFSNSDFLSNFTIFLELYLGQLKLLNVENPDFKIMIDNQVNFINNNFWLLLNNEKLPDSIDVNFYFEKILSFFNSRDNLLQYLTYIWNNWLLKRDSIKREYNKMLKIWDYLYSKYGNTNWLPKKDVSAIFEDELKKKVGDILLRENEDITFRLAERWFPLTINSYTIVDAKFDNIVSIDWKEYLNIEFYNEYNILKRCYIDFKWNVLKLKKGIIVEEIDYIFTFGWKNVIKYLDSNNNYVLDFVSIDDFKVIDNVFTDATIKSLIYNWSEFKYLLMSMSSINENSVMENYNQMFDENFQQITLFDLLSFLNDWKTDNFLDNIKKLESIPLIEISNVKIVDGITFAELTVMWEDLVKSYIVINNNWKIISIDWDNINTTYELKNILWRKFLPYWLDDKFIDWFLDKNLKTLEIPFNLLKKNIKSSDSSDIKRSLNSLSKNNEKLNIDIRNVMDKSININNDTESKDKYIFSVKKIHSKIVDWESENYFMLNNGDKLIISEENLEIYLSEFEEFSEIIDSFVLELNDNTDIKSEKWELLKKIYVRVNSDRQLLFYSENNDRFNWDYIISEFKKSPKWKELINYIWKRINSL